MFLHTNGKSNKVQNSAKKKNLGASLEKEREKDWIISFAGGEPPIIGNSVGTTDRPMVLLATISNEPQTHFLRLLPSLLYVLVYDIAFVAACLFR